jgi:hypothetical protein
MAVECDYQEGKSILARRRTPLRPAVTLAEALETTRSHGVAGRKLWGRPACKEAPGG